jgi:hypothetical protein
MANEFNAARSGMARQGAAGQGEAWFGKAWGRMANEFYGARFG